jgi:hypothetical protein
MSCHCLQNFVPKLKAHLLPRIKELLQLEKLSNELDSETQVPDGVAGCEMNSLQSGPNNHDVDAVLFKNDCIYKHRLIRINYTTYDVRRDQDVINPGTSHNNIMLLSAQQNEADPEHHNFIYAHVLGIYHANIIYVGTGMVDYNPRRLDFLWVRWYQQVPFDSLPDVTRGKKASCQLKQLCFPPMATEDALGFVDPADIVRGCHIIPRFSQGRRHADGIGISRCVQDNDDWNSYYIGQYVFLLLFKLLEIF